ncbi:Alpha/Beta hydrolase protein [Aspergillus transmontanensis]|uniref:Carboxylic ester hydrolase n=1 Tax=Aspergillus transmontanensis TaxID=1034304 RepID=A0A5N6VHP9_9EURO|nr:Alpha/Beta hydrolase protein [Aspergillus transmontanensis]
MLGQRWLNRVLRGLAFSYVLMLQGSHCRTYNTVNKHTGHQSLEPTARVLNGTYYGVHNDHYDQDLFLGMPYAQQPVGDLRLRTPQSLNESWTTPRNATEYSPACLGYGQTSGASEACLTLNVVRPSGASPSDNLPVSVWIYGGGFTGGSSSDPRYNLTFIVNESVTIGTPMIGVSINYRLHCWGYMWSKEMKEEGIGNLGFRDQRLALHWIQENIDAFGGDPSQVTIWGESAGGNSVGTQLIAYGGRDDGLFRAAISESGSPSTYIPYQTPEKWQPYYDAVVDAANCSSASDTLQCLRTIPTDILISIFNNSTIIPAHTLTGIEGPQFVQVIDGDFIQESATLQLEQGKFVRVPYLIGGNTDEGTSFAVRNIDNDEQFREVVSNWGLDNATVDILAALYPDIPQIGIPAIMPGRPPAGYGKQYKRVAAFQGDVNIHAPRRLATQAWARHDVPVYSYLFNVVNNLYGPYAGANHGAEIPYVFRNAQSLGRGDHQLMKAQSQLAILMSRSWVNFVATLDPNPSATSGSIWPRYRLEDPRNVVFDLNVTNLEYVADDFYRAEGIKYISDNLVTLFGR